MGCLTFRTFEARQTLVQIQVQPPTAVGNLGKLINFSKPPFPCQWTGESSICLARSLY